MKRFLLKLRSVFRVIYWTSTFLISGINVAIYIDRILHPTSLYYFHIAFLIISIIVFLTNIFLFIERYVTNKLKRSVTTGRRYIKFINILLSIITSLLTIFSFSSINSIFGIIFLPISIFVWTLNIFITIIQIIVGHIINKKRDRQERKMKEEQDKEKDIL